ncbi:TRAF3-interacting JNK-activating modulator [Manis javanica]|nr:TRAF3-interacting JNK-activating modulator [Manis javanica]
MHPAVYNGKTASIRKKFQISNMERCAIQKLQPRLEERCASEQSLLKTARDVAARERKDGGVATPTPARTPFREKPVRIGSES